MSDDLISRKAAVELVIAEYDRFQAAGGSYSGRYELDKAIKMLQNMQTAFDKEKVIKDMYLTGRKYCENVSCEEECDDCDHRVIMNSLIKIVEKGGIE